MNKNQMLIILNPQLARLPQHRNLTC